MYNTAALEPPVIASDRPANLDLPCSQRSLSSRLHHMALSDLELKAERRRVHAFASIQARAAEGQQGAMLSQRRIKAKQLPGRPGRASPGILPPLASFSEQSFFAEDPATLRPSQPVRFSDLSEVAACCKYGGSLRDFMKFICSECCNIRFGRPVKSQKWFALPGFKHCVREFLSKLLVRADTSLVTGCGACDRRQSV